MEEFYPGSKKRKKDYAGSVPAASEESEERLEIRGRNFTVGNNIVELFNVGALASALNRKPVTVRKWEQEGVIPKAPMILPSHDERGQRRLYTKEHIEGLRRIAAEEGVLNPNANGKWKPIEGTKFREKALELFRTLGN